jgi:site-specific DNA recombinase
MKKNKIAVLYCRVACDDKNFKYRLEYQELELRNYCIDNNINVIDCFSEIFSGSNFNRPQWKALISYIRNNPGLIDLLLIHSWDRFSRNISEALSEMDRLNRLGVKIICSEFYIDFSNPNSKVNLVNSIVIPEIESRKKSERTRLSMSRNASSGYFMGLAPIGYKNFNNKNGKSILIIDPERLHSLKIFFLIFQRGKYRLMI